VFSACLPTCGRTGSWDWSAQSLPSRSDIGRGGGPPSVAAGSSVHYVSPMGRRCVLALTLLMAIASCTSSLRPSPTGESTARYARYYFVAPKDTGVFEVWAHPATICYSTQSYPARPIDLIARANGTSNRVASYEPPRVEYCDRAVDEEVATALISDPSSFLVRWSPQAGEPVVMTPLTPTSSR